MYTISCLFYRITTAPDCITQGFLNSTGLLECYDIGTMNGTVNLEYSGTSL